MFTRLRTYFEEFMDFWTDLNASPFEDECWQRIRSAPIIEPPVMTHHLCMPGKFRPYILSSHSDAQEALSALEIVAAALSGDGWLVYRVHDGLWLISKDGELNSRLEVLSTAEAVKV